MTTKRIYSGICLAAVAAIVAQPALAHGGDHGASGLVSALQHVAQSPFHMMLAALAGGFSLVLLGIVRRQHRKAAVTVAKDAQ